MQTESTMQQTNSAPIGWGTRISYGLGDTACNIVMGITTAVLTLFYTDYAGVSVATVGLVMLISRIFDGTSDVIMGIIVNHTKSKWGKARPWILWMAIPYALCTISLFCIPQSNNTVQFWYIFVTYNLTTTVCYTAINVPYGTLSTLMTRSSHERDLLSVIRMGLSPFGKIIAVTFTLPIVKMVGNDQAAWIKVMSVWCIIAVILLAICFVRCKETVSFEAQQNAQPKVTAGRSLKALLGNPYFWATLILWAVTCIHTTIIGTDLPYYCKYVLGNDDNELYLADGDDHHPFARPGSADLCRVRHDGRCGRVRPVEESHPAGKPDLRRGFAGLQGWHRHHQRHHDCTARGRGLPQFDHRRRGAA